MKYYENVLESFNFYIKDQIIEIIKNAASNDSDICSLKDRFHQIEVNEKEIFKQKSRLIVFLITKNYLESSLFDKNLNEAECLKKDIYILLIEGGLDSNNPKYKKYKVYNICDAVDKCINF